jgi:two-component system C4-dicarboxylate transport response regulator DctD
MSFEQHPLVAFIDDDPDLRAANVQALEVAGLEVMAFASAGEALLRLGRDFPGVVVTDIRMPQIDGHEFFRRLREIDPDLPVILITGHGDVDEAVGALQEGAYDFVPKPYAMERLEASIRRALRTRWLVLDNRHLEALAGRPEPDDLLIGDTAVMQRLRDTVRQVAEADIDVLIEGETGVGKELVARALHRSGPRRGRTFATINCAALPAETIETELFGHEAGAFAGAVRRRVGRLEAAHGGTLFLDDVENVPLSVQSKLLRVLEEREITPLGANEVRAVDFRVIASSKVDLAQAIDRGEFRSDLFFRLNVIRVRIPPLRERRPDIPLLFARFLHDAAHRHRRDTPPITDSVRQRLLDHPWPGNVRELRHFAEQVALGLASPHKPQTEPQLRLPERLEAFEMQILRDTLEATQGDVRATVTRLGVPRKTLYDKLRRYGIAIDDFRR